MPSLLSRKVHDHRKRSNRKQHIVCLLPSCILTLILSDFRPGFPTKALLALRDAQRRATEEGKEGIWWISGGSSFQESHWLPQPFRAQSGGQLSFSFDRDFPRLCCRSLRPRSPREPDWFCSTAILMLCSRPHMLCAAPAPLNPLVPLSKEM